MTPMIDVVFQLLIFFVCTVSFQAVEEVLPTNLRAQGSGTGAPQLEPELQELEEIVVRLVWQEGRTHWIVNDRPYNYLAQVRAVLVQSAQIRPDLPVILDAAGDVPLGDVIDLYDVGRIAGFDKIHFAAHGK